MNQHWQPGMQLNQGQHVMYDGREFVVQQPHVAQGDWTPDVAHSLFGRTDVGGGGGGKGPGEYGQYAQQQHQQQGGRKERRGSQSSSDDDEEFEKLSDEKKEQKKKFYETDKFKLGAQIAGGAVAVAGLAGVGAWAYNKHTENEKKEAWREANLTEDKYLSGARARAGKYGAIPSSQVPAVRWVLVEKGGKLPEGALQIGQEADGTPLYAARAFHDGCASIGKTWPDKERANIPHKEKEVLKKEYEVLVGSRSSVRWMKEPRGKPCAPEGYRPVEGGRDGQGNFLFVARAAHGGGMHPAEVTEGHRDAEIPFGGKVVHVEEFELLAYDDQDQGQRF